MVLFVVFHEMMHAAFRFCPSIVDIVAEDTVQTLNQMTGDVPHRQGHDEELKEFVRQKRGILNANIVTIDMLIEELRRFLKAKKPASIAGIDYEEFMCDNAAAQFIVAAIVDFPGMGPNEIALSRCAVNFMSVYRTLVRGRNGLYQLMDEHITRLSSGSAEAQQESDHGEYYDEFVGKIAADEAAFEANRTVDSLRHRIVENSFDSSANAHQREKLTPLRDTEYVNTLISSASNVTRIYQEFESDFRYGVTNNFYYHSMMKVSSIGRGMQLFSFNCSEETRLQSYADPYSLYILGIAPNLTEAL